MQDTLRIIETKFPETVGDYKKITKDQMELFAKKQNEYGPGNI